MIIVTQESTKLFLEEIVSHLPMNEADLNVEMKARCEQICDQSSLQTAEEAYGISATELESISQQLSVYSNLLFEQYRQQNANLLKKFEEQVEEVYFVAFLALFCVMSD